MLSSSKNKIVVFFISLLLVGFIACKSSQKSGSTVAFQNRSWKLVELNSTPVVLSADAKPVTINFGVTDFRGSGGCNNMNGLYVIKDDMIKIGSVMSTKMSCENAKYETDFFKMLEQCNKFGFKKVKTGSVKKQQLILMLDEKTLAVFE